MVGCKKDNDLSDNPSDRIQGRWDLTKEYNLDKKNGIKTNEGTDTFAVGDFYIVFSGNTVKVYDGGQLDDEGSFIINSDEIILDFGGGDIAKSPISWTSNSEFVIKSTASVTQGSDTYVYYSEETFKKN